MMRRPKRELWLIALVCLGPVVLALLTYYGAWELGWIPRLPGSRELIEPQVALPATPLEGPDGPMPGGWARYRWSLIYARITACEERCAQHLGRLHQVQLALGRDLDRVQRVYLYAGDAAAIAADAQLLMGRLDDDRGAPLLRLLGEDRIQDGRIYICDPLGNLVLSYPADVEQKELLRDLQRLLDVSGIG
ncbi:MAG TPA: hypothetical protein VJA26_15605 [Gammaproteobacteria bacterium]|nr:hypothetical protein [Gammaproteobacteria bacterium]